MKIRFNEAPEYFCSECGSQFGKEFRPNEKPNVVTYRHFNPGPYISPAHRCPNDAAEFTITFIVKTVNTETSVVTY